MKVHLNELIDHTLLSKATYKWMFSFSQQLKPGYLLDFKI